MERFSFMAPTGRFTQGSIASLDRLALSRIQTPSKHATWFRESGLRNYEEPPPMPTSRIPSSVYPSNYVSRYASKAPSMIQSSEYSTEHELKDLPSAPESPLLTEFQPGTRFYLAFSALAALSLVVALDGTSISVALPTIAKALNGSATDAFWAGTAFLLSSTVFQPIYAAFSHIFGRKNLCLLAVSFFLVGTLVAGTAQNMIMMLIGRAVQGIGGGGVTALTAILITDLVPLRHRGKWIGVLGAMWAVGSVSGPVVGGALAEPNLWSWIFYLNIPFITISFALVYFFIRLKALPTTLAAKLRQADWVGSIIFCASITSILVPLTWGGSMYPWTSWRTIVPAAFGVTGFIILAYHERFVALEPIIRAEIFANRTTNIAYVSTALHGMVLWALLYYQPIYFEGVRGMSPVLSGVALFPATFTVAPMAIATGLAISKYGKYRWAIWAGWVLTTLGVGFMCAINEKTEMVQVVLTDLATGVGLGALFPALQFQLQSASNQKHLGSAVAMFSFSRGLGQTLGIAIGGNIFQNALESRLKKQPLFAADAATLAKDATGLVEWLRAAPAGDAREAMRTAFIDSIRMVYIVMAGFALAAAIASCFIKHYDMDRALETEQALADEGRRDAAREASERA